MRYVEEEKSKKGPKDELFFITKHSFKMSKSFGGVPEDYREFVTSNKELNYEELCHAYLKENEGAELNDSLKKKVDKKCVKLGFYFN